MRRGFYITVVVSAVFLAGCAKDTDDARKALVGHWVEDRPVKLNVTDPDCRAVTVTPDGWLRSGTYSPRTGRVDSTGVTEERYALVPGSPHGPAHVRGEDGTIVAPLVGDEDHAWLSEPGPAGRDAGVRLRRSSVAVPTTQPIVRRGDGVVVEKP